MIGRLAAIVGMFGAACVRAHAGDPTVSFERDIRPILSNACFQCHGPDEAARKADLRLDVAESALESRDGIAAIVPGDAEASAVYQRIIHTDPDERMPPAHVDKDLTEEQIGLIRRWIEDGAQWSTHWAFVPPQRPDVPTVATPGWNENPIDAFIAQRLEAAGLTPAEEADRITLLRRLTLDLTGLPPSLDDIERVVADDSENWYDNLVERLLASPHYGERWARYWMDAAQYADSDGFEKDKPRDVWVWRDWLINALNDDMPYDRFVIKQVAGDLLPNATQSDQIATGFLRNSMINEEGGIDPEQFRMEAQFNRMDIVGRAVLGLTVQCAQCHTHKYDPISHTEYYQMLSFLNNAYDACISVYSAEEEKQRDDILDLVRDLKGEIKEDHTDWRDRMTAWEEKVAAEPTPQWDTLALTVDDTSAGGQKFTPQNDGSYLAQGYSPTNNSTKMTAETSLKKITAIRLEAITDPRLPRNGPGRSPFGAFALSEFLFAFTNEALPIAEFDKWTKAEIASAVASVNPAVSTLDPQFSERDENVRERITGPIAMAIDGNAKTAWTTDIDPIRRNASHVAIFVLKEPITVAENTQLALRLDQRHGGWNNNDNHANNIGRFRVSVTDAEALPSEVVPPALEARLKVPRHQRTETDEAAIFSHWRTTEPALAAVNARIDALLGAIPDGTTQLVVTERDEPLTTHRLERGDFLQPAEAVSPGVPAFLQPLKTEGATPTRLDFAKWLVARDAPTTARAYVNRVWQHYFGQGIVATSSDLGSQGEPPTHPELLDWLAVEFMDSGWRVKDLHRLIVRSKTYKQASQVSPELLERDPYNRLHARGARYRVHGETVRDIALAASGLLEPKVGGPSVFPPAPQFLFEPPASYSWKRWDVETDADRYRRALYTFRFRSVPYPVLQAFDTPAGDAPCTRRNRSNTPLQALATLNESVFFVAAGKLAESTIAHGGATDAERIEFAFRRCVTRAPDPDEADRMAAFLDDQRARLRAGELDAQAILRSANIATDSSTGGAEELAAWTLLSRALLNLDETITRQ